MVPARWKRNERRRLEQAIDEKDEQGKAITDQTLLMLLNAHTEALPFVLPEQKGQQQWALVLDTRAPIVGKLNVWKTGGDSLTLEAHSLAVLVLDDNKN